MSSEFSIFQATIASGASVSGEVDLGYGWRNAYLEIPAMSNTTYHIQASANDGGTYRRTYHAPFPQSQIVAASGVFTIHSSVTNAIVPIPAGLRYMKVESVNALTDGGLYKIIVGE